MKNVMHLNLLYFSIKNENNKIPAKQRKENNLLCHILILLPKVVF